jgi:hypothetical protein
VRLSPSLLGCLALGPWLLLPACRTRQDHAQRAEAAALVQAVTLLRDAPNPAKRPHLKALVRLACSTEDLCELQRVCKNAYERHQQALDITRTLRAGVEADGGIDRDSGASANDLVDHARRDLDRARYLARLCNDLQGQVTRRYGL